MDATQCVWTLCLFLSPSWQISFPKVDTRPSNSWSLCHSKTASFDVVTGVYFYGLGVACSSRELFM